MPNHCPSQHQDSHNNHPAIAATRQWFEQVVLGLNLCPFAHRPARQQQIRFCVSDSDNDAQLLETLIAEIHHLEQTPTSDCDTTLLIVPNLFKDFYDYQFFMEEAQRHLKRNHWLGEFQLASFHPAYCFAGAEPEDPTNLTNRSPYPIVHILREASLSEALKNVDHPDEIPERNMALMEELSEDEIKEFFPYLPQ